MYMSRYMKKQQGTIALSKNPVCRQRSKYVDIKYHFVQSTHAEGKISVNMVADVLTKPVIEAKFERFKGYFWSIM